MQMLTELRKGDARLDDDGIELPPALEFAYARKPLENDNAAVGTETHPRRVPLATGLHPFAPPNERVHGALYTGDILDDVNLRILRASRDIGIEPREPWTGL